ncbi:MAG: M50 family metallopeptidase [Luteolibacter sp.]
MIRFSLFGIPVRVHPFFWLTLAVIGGALSADSPEAIFRILLFLLAGFISILVHELGHALTARKFGARSEIVLQAFGGYAAYSGVRMTRPQSFMITAAGPAVQIGLGIALLMVIPSLPELNQNALYFLVVLNWISLVWALLNLLPVLPLDGGQMLNAVLGPDRIKTTLWISLVVAATAGLLLYLLFKSLLAPIFMGMFAWQSWQALRENRWR